MATRVPSPDAIRLSGSLSVVRPAAAQTAGGFETFIRIAADGTVTAFNGHVDLGTGIRTALALSFILLVSSELIVARKSFGYLIGSYGANGTYDAMYAVVMTVAFLGFAADRVYLMITKRALAWRA